MQNENSSAIQASTSPPSKFYGLDHIRALAIILVAVFHYQILSSGDPQWLQPWIKFCWTGVDLFFVLSGFLIASQLFLQIKTTNKINLKDFFIKRFFRIIPAYVVVLAIYFSIPFFHEKESLSPLWKFLTFTQNFDLNLKDFGTFSHAWSLCVEEHFYLCFPFILFFLVKKDWLKKSYWIILSLFVLSILLRTYSYQFQYLPKLEEENSWRFWYQYIYYPTYNRLDGLLVGVVIAAIYQFWPKVWSRISAYGNISLVLAGLVICAAYLFCSDAHSFQASVFGFSLVALAFGLMVLSAICPNSVLYRWKSKTTTYIATLSYAIYLSHKGIIHMTQVWIGQLDWNLNPTIVFCICMINCVLGAQLLHFCIEKPFMKLRHRFVTRPEKSLQTTI